MAKMLIPNFRLPKQLLIIRFQCTKNCMNSFLYTIFLVNDIFTEIFFVAGNRMIKLFS